MINCIRRLFGMRNTNDVGSDNQFKFENGKYAYYYIGRSKYDVNIFQFLQFNNKLINRSLDIDEDCKNAIIRIITDNYNKFEDSKSLIVVIKNILE